MRLIHIGDGGVRVIEDRVFIDTTEAKPRIRQKLAGVLYAKRNREARDLSQGNGYKPGKLMDLAADQCRYIAGNDLVMCGQKTHRRDMCEAHYKMCWGGPRS
jgi:hypothetical protein